MQRRRRPDILPQRLIECGAAAALSGQLAACSAVSEPGTRVELVSSGSALLAGQEVSTAGGGLLRVDELFWTVSELELRPCQTAWQSAASWLVATAHAHGTSSPTLLAVPTVQSATHDGDTALGRMSPPAGRYCGVRYQLGLADADAQGLAQAPDMLGHSFLLRGSVTAGAAEHETLQVESERTFDIELEVDFELSASSKDVTLRFTRGAQRVFQDIDFAVLTGVRRELALLEGLQAALTVEVE
jgi:hypothetical protein